VVTGALLVAGTSSDAGKSVLVAGLCRWLARQGVRVAPFKAQNMALNSAVTADGAEIGRAQAMQAAAAGIEPEAAMNPVLLKPGSDTRSQVVLLGRPVADAGALDYQDLKPRLEQAVADSLADLRRRFDVVICEGAGSPAEINLRGRDLANMGLARAAALPVVVVGDIDRGGLLAAMFGTLAVLEPADQRLIAGFIVNKFRGDLRLLAPGLDMLASMTGRPTYGVLPWRRDLWLEAEDSLDLDTRPREMLRPVGADILRIAVVRLPRMSNVTDVDPLAAEPGVAVDLVTTPGQMAGADLVILPGSRATVSDLGWLRETGIAAAITERATCGLPVLGICGGYQMLATSIEDDVESHAGTVPGLDLLPAQIKFATAKTLTRPTGTALGEPVSGYEIHHGVVTVTGGIPFLDGCEEGSVRGTTWHGIFDSDGFRRAFLADLAARTGRDFTPASDVRFTAVRERRYDVLADMISEHLDTAALLALIGGGPPAGLPTVVSGLAGLPVLQVALGLQVSLPQRGQPFAVRGVPELAVCRLEQPFGDAVQGPGVGAAEEFAHLLVADVGVGELLVHPVLDHARRGVVAEQVVDRGGEFEGALVAMAFHGLDPARVDHPGAENTRGLLGQRPGADGIRAGGVADVRAGRPARERPDGGDHPPVVLEVVVGVGDVMLEGVGVVRGHRDPPVGALHVIARFPAVQAAAVREAAPHGVHLGQVGVIAPVPGVDQRQQPGSVRAGPGAEDAGGGAALVAMA